jgi:tagaturonate epimerase
VQGADADHLKTNQDVDRTAAAGFTFFTIDPSDYVDPTADDASPDALAAQMKRSADVEWVQHFRGKGMTLPSGRLEISDRDVARCAVKYGKAVNHAVALAKYIESVAKKAGRGFEIELSVDETPQPTTPAEHFIIASRLAESGVRIVSLAPRFVGEFEKGVDFKGDIKAFERSLADHAAIARQFRYKLSLHSGSDKLSVYPALARITGGMWHVKTAGTSYLEALRAVLRHDVGLFRKIVDFSRGRYEKDKATYHVSATLATTPPPSDIKDDVKLEQVYLQRWEDVAAGKGFTEPGRQILHTTFGSVLTDASLKSQVMQILREHPRTYSDILEEHFARHLDALRMGMR